MARLKKNERIVDMFQSQRSGVYREADIGGVRANSPAWRGPIRCKVITGPDGNETVEPLPEQSTRSDDLIAGYADDDNEGGEEGGANPDTSFC